MMLLLFYMMYVCFVPIDRTPALCHCFATYTETMTAKLIEICACKPRVDEILRESFPFWKFATSGSALIPLGAFPQNARGRKTVVYFRGTTALLPHCHFYFTSHCQQSCCSFSLA
jgi:hypothetical protein